MCSGKVWNFPLRVTFGHGWAGPFFCFFFRWFSLGSWCDWKWFMGPPSPLHNPHWTWLDGWQLFWDAPIWRYLQCFEPEPKLTPTRPLRFRCLRVLAHGWSSTITSWWTGTSTLDVLDANTLKPLGLLLSWLNWRTFMNFHPRNWHFKGRMMKIREFCPGPGSRNSTEIGQPFPTWCTWPCWWRCPSYVGNRRDRFVGCNGKQLY